MTMTIVGILVRLEEEHRAEVAERLSAIEGVSTFEVEQPGSLGALLEAPDLDRAHAILREQIEPTEGVLAAWPVHSDFSDDEPPAS